jgi:periplasmic protein TonB
MLKTGFAISAVVHFSLILLAYIGVNHVKPLRPKMLAFQMVQLKLAPKAKPVKKQEVVKPKPKPKPKPTPKIIKKKKKPPIDLIRKKKKRRQAKKVEIKRPTPVPTPVPKPAPKRNAKNDDRKISIDAPQNVPVARYRYYLELLVQKLTENWYPPPEPAMILAQRVARVSFVIQKNGSLTKIKLEKASGSDAFDRAALDAVRNASPLPEGLPPDFKGKPLKVTAPFLGTQGE